MTSYVYFLPELFLGISLSVLLVWGAAVSTDGKRNYPVLSRPRIGLSGWVLRRVGFLVLEAPDTQRLVEDGRTASLQAFLAHDGRTVVCKLLTVVAALATLASRTSYVAWSRLQAFEYSLLRLLAVLGRRILISADDLRLFYLALELQSLALYVLASFRRGSAYSTEAGLKYFRLGAFASGLFLLGASLVYGFLGTTSYEAIGRLLAPSSQSLREIPGLAPVSAGLLLRLRAVAFKLAVAPFHRWSPDVLEGSPSSSSRFFASVTKVARRAALLRLCYGPFYGLRLEAGIWELLAGRSALSRRVAALAALGQRRRKRFLGYSAIGHRGYRWRGLACGTLEGVRASRRYLAIYVVGSIGLWSAWISTRRVGPDFGATSWRESKVVERAAIYLTDLGGLAQRHPALARVVALSRFSRAGVPPRSGFLAKLGVFFAARESSNHLLAFVGILTSIVGAYYYLRVIKIRYFEGASAADVVHPPVDRGSARVRSVAVFLTSFLRVNPSLLEVRCQRAALALVA